MVVDTQGLWIRALWWCLLVAPVSAANVEGLVIDQQNRPMTDIPVFLVYGDGLHVQASSGEDGRFSFEDVPSGQAMCYVNLPAQYQVTYPACGEHPVHVGSAAKDGTKVFKLISDQGVILPFGKPFKPRKPDPNVEIKPIMPAFEADLQVYSTIQYDPQTLHGGRPTVIEVTGRWSLPRQPGITLSMNPVAPAGHTADFPYDVILEDLGDGRCRLRYQAHPGAVLEAGLTAVFTMTTVTGVDVRPGPIHFCAEETTVFEGEQLLLMNHHQVWQGEIEINHILDDFQ